MIADRQDKWTGCGTQPVDKVRFYDGEWAAYVVLDMYNEDIPWDHL